MGHTKAEKIALREQGLTYRQIADRLGISTQAVAQVLSKRQPSRFRLVAEEGCVYVGIRNWMNENKVGFTELVRRCGLQTAGGTYPRWRSYLTGQCDPPKRTIDKILRVTGLTYEEAFGRVDDES